MISPLLITFLIVKVSGIAPLEEKMKNHSDFPDYAKNTPSLIPFSLINGALYMLAYLIAVFYGAKGSFFLPLLACLLNYTIQLYLLSKLDPKSFLISIPLSLYALFFGLIQEMLFIHFGLVSYPGQGFFPPFWLLSLYPLFSLTLNSSLRFLNWNLCLTFCLGGAGSLLSYLSGEWLGAAELHLPSAYPWLFASWGLYVTILILLNRRLMALRDAYTDPERIGQPLTVFFDNNCPICSREMAKLKKRRQTGSIAYASPQSDEELKKMTDAFSYKQAMEKIHALDAKGRVQTGLNVLAALYARTDLPILAIALQAPGFRTLFKLAYAIWAKFRIRISAD
jgi:predicted DCC family thiol-disulfide oxidoreductase YuxK